MAASTPERWEPVETIGAASGPLGLVDAAVRAAGIEARRFRSAAGARAILLPVGQLDRGPLSAEGLSPGVTHVLFLDPVPAEAVTALLAGIDEPARSVRLAVAGVAPAGSIAEAGRIVVGADPAVSFLLYRVVGEPEIAPGPRLGESSDVTDARSRWFDARHGGPTDEDGSVDG